MSEYHVRAIPANLVDRFWTHAEAYIKRALDHTSGEWLPSDIKLGCEHEQIQLWLVTEGSHVVGAITTQIVIYPQKRHCRVITLAGSKAAEWTQLVVTILDDWAKEHGCHAMEAFVRKGYVPILAKYGYKFKHSVVVKDI